MPGDQPQAKEPEESWYEIALFEERKWTKSCDKFNLVSRFFFLDGSLFSFALLNSSLKKKHRLNRFIAPLRAQLLVGFCNFSTMKYRFNPRGNCIWFQKSEVKI